MTYVICTIVGIIAGVIISNLMMKKHKIGNLRIDRSDPTEEPYLFLEIYADNSVGGIEKRKYVVLDVVARNYITQE